MGRRICIWRLCHAFGTIEERLAGAKGWIRCGFLVPAAGLNPLVRDAIHKPYWSGLLLPGLLIFSAHFIHKSPTDGNTDTYIDRIRQETQDFYIACSKKYPKEKLSVVACFDANVTLPPSHLGITGPLTLPPLRSHTCSMQHGILSWLLQFGLRALNTFGVDNSPHLLWTCGWKRSLPDRSQIDYVAVSEDVLGSAYPAREWDVRGNEVLRKGMDHRRVIGNLELQRDNLPRPPEGHSLKGWKPLNHRAYQQFQSRAVSAEVLNTNLQNLEATLLRIASETDYTTKRMCESIRYREQKDILQRYQNSAMSSLEPEVRKDAMKQKLAVQKKRAQERTATRLSRLAAERLHNEFTPTSFEIRGAKVYDRAEWLVGLREFGELRFGDPQNGINIQRARLAKLTPSPSELAHGENCDAEELWDFLQARAKLRPNTAAGPDDVPPEVHGSTICCYAPCSLFVQEASPAAGWDLELALLEDAGIHWHPQD